MKKAPKHTKRYTWEYVPEFAVALIHQLHIDQHKWGDEWRRRPNTNQTGRIYGALNHYYYNYNEHGAPVPWLKVAGLALIAWIRETYIGWDVDPKDLD